MVPVTTIMAAAPYFESIDSKSTSTHDTVLRAARALLESVGEHRDVVLAVSGGRDSMVLLDAVDAILATSAAMRPLRTRIAVATFDHGSGRAATAAADLVQSDAERRGFVVHRGRALTPLATEAEWRAARWSFLLGLRTDAGVVATAHTRDDHLETVVMRCLRGAGARGLAALSSARRHVVRPFLDVPRRAVEGYARDRGVPFIEDPSNASRAHLRNRIRHDLLPAISRVRPTFGDAMLDVARRAADWRADVDRHASRYVSESPDDRALRVARHELATYDSKALCVLWPAIAARAGITLDRRGTRRLAQFTTEGASGARIQLSGGFEVVRQRDVFVVRPLVSRELELPQTALSGVLELDGWRFAPISAPEHPFVDSPVSNPADRTSVGMRDDCWTCDLPADRPLSVRSWRPADRMRWNSAGSARRVKRFFADAKVSGISRVGWPVVLADDEIVWIPGVRRSAAAPERSGRPVVRYTCERFERGARQVS
jgi:tRNA(Ile)-lysidine synthase